MKMKKKLSTIFLGGALALACFAGGVTALDGNVTADAEASFKMVDGAAVRIADDGKYGMRFVAEVGETYDETLNYKLMIIPEDYITTYALSESTDLYGDLYNALYDEETNPEPYIATVWAQPFTFATEEEAEARNLEMGKYYVQGTLGVSFENSNRDFFGIAFTETVVEEGQTPTRVYATYNVGENVRNVVKVASASINAGEDADDENGVLMSYVQKGINQAAGLPEATDVSETLAAIGSASSVKILDKKEETLALNLPEGVDLDVVYAVSETESVLDKAKALNGTLAPSAYGETTLSATVLGKTYTTAVQSYKSNDWTFDIDNPNYYDFTSTIVSAEADAPEAVTGDIFSRNNISTAISDGTLKINFTNDNAAVTFAVENLLDSSYVEGEYVYAQMRMKAVDANGEPIAWDAVQLFAFIGADFGGARYLSEVGTTTLNQNTFTVSNEDSEGYKTLTWYTPLSDYYQSFMYEAENAGDGFYATTPWVFQFLPWSGLKNGTLVIDWIKADTTATKVDQTFDLVTSKTYGGKDNAINTTATLDVLYTLAGEETEVASLVDGVITAGAKSGTASFTVNGTDDASIAYGGVTVNVSSAISSKFDLDMLALAYARGTYTTDWAATAKYVLTNDIDYNGELFIPIAANTRGIDGETYFNIIGKQWATILAEGNEYGLSYADFSTKGLNGYAWTRSEVYGAADQTMFFNATFDGNGYAIKNPKLMHDAVVSNALNNFSMTSHVFGLLGSHSVLKNLSIENVTLQTYTEAGYVSADGWHGLNDISGAVYARAVGNNYSFTGFGVFGNGAGTMENVYAEWNTCFDKGYGMAWLDMTKFGRWEAATKLTDCIFVDNQTALEGVTTNGVQLMTVVSGATLTADNVIVISAQAKSGGGTVSGTFTIYADVAALETAYEADNTLFNGYEDWNITVADGVLTATLK